LMIFGALVSFTFTRKPIVYQIPEQNRTIVAAS
jgi:hypothetical protein